MICTICFGLHSSCTEKPPAAGPPPPPEVQVIELAPTEVPLVREWVASLDGTTNAAINAQVSGYIIRQNYREGTMVKKGDLLFEIDDRPFVAAHSQADAQLAQAQAQLGKTKLDVDRYRPLAATDAISKQELDNAVQANLAAKAQVEAAKAALDKTTIDLEFTKIVAPIDGLAGFANVAIGDLVGPGTKTLTTISTIDPIRAYFSPSEQEYLRYEAKRKAEGVIDMSKDPGPELSLLLADGSEYPEKGKIIFADRQINPRTGAIRLASSFPNPKERLRPGMFARVMAMVENRKNAITVPQRAVTEIQGTYQVWVVDHEGKVNIRNVKLADRKGADWVVAEGLQSGEKIVVEGVQKLRPGIAVRAVPFVPPVSPQGS